MHPSIFTKIFPNLKETAAKIKKFKKSFTYK